MSPALVRPFPRPAPRFAAIILTLGVLALQGVAFAQIVKEDAWVPDGRVRAVTFANGLLYVGGYFTGWGPSIPSAVTLDGGTGVARTPYPNVKGRVFAAVPDGNGGVYIGGSFTSVQGQARLNIAQLDATGALTTWNPSANGEVDAIAVSGGVVYLGGTFSVAGSQFRDRIAAISPATGSATAWNPGADSKVRFICVDGPRVYLGGDFTSVGGELRAKVACVDAVSAVPSSWQPGGIGFLSSMVLGAGRLFTARGGINEIRVYDSATGDSIAGAPTVDNSVNAMVVDPSAGTVYAAGLFDFFGGIAREGVAAFDAATLSVLTWAPVTSTGIFPKALAFASGVLYVGGVFHEVNGLPRDNVFAIDVPTATIKGWNPRVGGEDVLTLVADGATVFVGGNFSTANMVTHRGLAAIDPATGIPTAWSPNVEIGVEAIAVNGNTVYFVGPFGQVNGVSRARAASVDATTGAVTGWNPTIDGAPACLAVFGSTVYLGGGFSTVGGAVRPTLAAVDATTGAVLSFNPGTNGVVTTMRLVVPNDIMVPPTLFIGGSFTFVNGSTSRNRLASIDTGTGAATSWNPDANGPVTQLNVFTNSFGAVTKVYVAGSFTTIGGVARPYIAELGPTGVPTAWIPAPNAGVACFATSFSSVYLGGGFTSVGGQTRNEIAEVDLTTAFPTNWNPGTGEVGPIEFVHTITRAGSNVIVGGSYRSIGQRARSYFALIGQAITAVASEPAPVAPSVVRATPNPFEGSTTLRFALPHSERADVTIYDTVGRLVRRIHAGALVAGEHRLRWDGTNDRGRGVASGIYFLSVRTPTLRMGSKIFRLR